MNEFTFVVKYNPEDNPNELGEALRNEFFDQDAGLRGCYSTFELRDGVQFTATYPSYPNCLEYVDTKLHRKVIDGKMVSMIYWWDGDGTLEFHFEDGSYLYNGDCKKDYVWKYYKNLDSK